MQERPLHTPQCADGKCITGSLCKIGRSTRKYFTPMDWRLALVPLSELRSLPRVLGYGNPSARPWHHTFSIRYVIRRNYSSDVTERSEHFLVIRCAAPPHRLHAFSTSHLTSLTRWSCKLFYKSVLQNREFYYNEGNVFLSSTHPGCEIRLLIFLLYRILYYEIVYTCKLYWSNW